MPVDAVGGGWKKGPALVPGQDLGVLGKVPADTCCKS